MSWVIPVVASLAAIAALLASRPSSRPLAVVAALLIAGSGAWSAIVEYQRSRAADAVAGLAYSDLQRSLGKAMSLVNQMLIAGSDGWLPKTHEERVSGRAAAVICRHLNVEMGAPVVPHRTWLSWINENTQRIREELNTAISAHAASLDPGALGAVASLRHSFLLKFPEQLRNVRAWDRTQGYQRPPLLCYGLESLMQESLVEVANAYEDVRKKADVPAYPLPASTDAPKLGSSHYSDADLESWAGAHPNAPSGHPVE